MKVILYMAMSVDGYIATKSDEAPWSDTVWQQYLKTVNEFGNIIVGKRTYDIMLDSGDFDDFDKRPKTIVLTSGGESLNEDETAGNPNKAIKKLENAGFERVLVGGGSKTAKSFLEAGLVDEVQIDVEPVMLGTGIPLLNESNEVKLKLSKTDQLGEGVVHLEYEVVK